MKSIKVTVPENLFCSPNMMGEVRVWSKSSMICSKNVALTNLVCFLTGYGVAMVQGSGSEEEERIKFRK